jgi:GNAT superfamily N-acetyltransferase
VAGRRSSKESAGALLVRGAHEDDLPRLLELLAACVEQMRAKGIDQWDDVYPNEATLRADVQRGACYVASAPGRPVAGGFVIDDRQEPEYAAVPWKIVGSPVGVVHRLMVHPAVQRRGLARHLMRFAELRARGLGYGAIRLDAFTGNAPSLGLYRGLGYDEVGGVRLRKGAFRCFEKGLA